MEWLAIGGRGGGTRCGLIRDSGLGTRRGNRMLGAESRIRARTYLLGFLDLDHSPSFVISALWTNMMRQLHLMTLGTFVQQRRCNVMMRTPGSLPGVRVSPFWIRHRKFSSGSKKLAAGRLLSRFGNVPESGPTRIRRPLVAGALSQIAVLAALGTQACTIGAADVLHGKRQQDLFLNGVLQQ